MQRGAVLDKRAIIQCSILANKADTLHVLLNDAVDDRVHDELHLVRVGRARLVDVDRLGRRLV